MKARDALLACPSCTKWPMVVIERKGNWRYRPVYGYVCVECGHCQDDRPNSYPANANDPVSSKTAGY